MGEVECGYYIDPDRMARYLRGKLWYAERKGWAQHIKIWPSNPQEQDGVRNLWKRRGRVIVECVLPEVDGNRWAISEVYWEELKAIGEHLDFCATGIMCKRSRMCPLTGQEQFMKLPT
jgi:hypothetical protein